MPRADTYEQVYDIETPIEAVLSARLVAIGFTDVFTRANAVEDFQKIRPRIELRVFVQGPLPTAHFHLQDLGQDEQGGDRQYKLIDQFRIEVAIQVVDQLARTAPGNTLHPLHRARVRHVLSRCQQISDDQVLPYHELARLWPAGMSHEVDDQDGLEFTVLRYEGTVIVRSGAWPLNP